MRHIKLSIPENGCEGCPFYREETVDHNYYGEISRTKKCVLFYSKESCDLAAAETKEEEKRTKWLERQLEHRS